MGTFETYLDDFQALAVSDETKKAIQALRPDLEAYMQNAQNLVTLALRGQSVVVVAKLPEFEAQFQQLANSFVLTESLIEAEAVQARTLGEQASYQAKRTAPRVAIVAIFLVTILGWWIARSSTQPLAQLTTAAAKIARGDINQRVDYQAADETGVLAAAFRELIVYIRGIAVAADDISKGNLAVQVVPRSEHDVLSRSFGTMVENSHDMIGKMQEAAQVLASSIARILASTSQLATSTHETATSVSQTATTVEEVKQTASVASRKAQDVSDAGQKTVQISQSGAQSVEEAVAGMDHMRTQMASIAGSVTKLEEHTQTIGEIVAMVNDLAEQSNLLAINAAIEAAKAGTAGKGFGVVAQEVKSLAERSKRATAQVQTLLTDIRRAASTTTHVTEQGTQSAETGVQQSLRAGESIRALTKTIEDSAQAVTQIATSSQQQLMGMDQVAVAIGNIKQASLQNVYGIQQVEKAAKDMQEVGQILRTLVEQYKLAKNGVTV
ncbi:MAG: methyl-accepting chemotaxis protein [Deltaproteobacteria bacterium]|nr:methyl-accepting chemotaxis protein [Deltaproteobacteria bacterium]